jgi:hypothetical protein
MIELRADSLNASHYAFGFGGTFLPARRASDNPIAIACLGFVTFLPALVFSSPASIAFISRSTLLLAAGLYFRLDVFFAADFLVVVFFAADLLVEAAFLLGDFFAAFFIAMVRTLHT